MGGQSVEDLERVIAAMRRVVERLQGENDQLKKTVGAGGPQYGEVLKENKRLKVFRLFLFVFFPACFILSAIHVSFRKSNKNIKHSLIFRSQANK